MKNNQESIIVAAQILAIHEEYVAKLKSVLKPFPEGGITYGGVTVEDGEKACENILKSFGGDKWEPEKSNPHGFKQGDLIEVSDDQNNWVEGIFHEYLTSKNITKRYRVSPVPYGAPCFYWRYARPIQEETEEITDEKQDEINRNAFMESIEAQLSNCGKTSSGWLGDGSGGWVKVKVGKRKFLNFSFDEEGNMDRIGLYKDVVEVTDEKQIWTTK